MEAIVLAGGLGTRLRPVVPNTAKPVAPVAGAPFLHHLMTHWAKAGVTRFVLATGYRASQVRDEIGDDFGGIPVTYSVEVEPLGTGGAVVMALPQLRSAAPFLVLNGDTFFPISATELYREHRARAAEATLTVFATDAGSRYGLVLADAMQRVTGFSAASGEAGWANGGVYCFEHRFFDGLTAGVATSLERDVLPRRLSDRPVYLFPSTALFVDIGTPADYARAQTLFKR